MNKKQKVKIVAELKNILKENEKELSNIYNIFGANPDGNFQRSVFKLQDFAIKQTSKIIGDNEEWLDWFIYENDWGEKAFEAGYDDNLKEIKTIDDLVDLLDS